MLHTLLRLRTSCATLLVMCLLTACGGGDTVAVDGLPIASRAAPAAPSVLAVEYAPKTYGMEWEPVDGAAYYEVFEDPDGPGPLPERVVAGPVQGTQATVVHTAPLYLRLNATYRVRACDQALCGPMSDPFQTRVEKAIGYFKASNTGAFDRFGSAVALSPDGQYLAVGAVGEDSSASGSFATPPTDNDALTGAGAVYVFVRESGQWRQQAYLKPSTPRAGSYFGLALAFSADGSTLAASAPLDNAQVSFGGVVYVFQRQGTTWSEDSVLRAPDRTAFDNFGYSIALSAGGDTLAIGVPGRDGGAGAGAGAVYVLTRTGSGWDWQLVRAADAATNDSFGTSVALDGQGQTLAVGALGEGSAAQTVGGDAFDTSAPLAGAAYVFTRTSGAWVQQAYIKRSRLAAYDRFGESVSLSADGNRLAVGAPDDDGGAETGQPPLSDSGAVYLFERNGTQWTERAYLKAANAGAGDSFGSVVALSGDGVSLLVGADSEDSQAIGIGGDDTDDSVPNAGAAYVFAPADPGWRQLAYLKAPATPRRAYFGGSVAVSADGRTLAIGSPGESSGARGIQENPGDPTAQDAGAVYLY